MHLCKQQDQLWCCISNLAIKKEEAHLSDMYNQEFVVNINKILESNQFWSACNCCGKIRNINAVKLLCTHFFYALLLCSPFLGSSESLGWWLHWGQFSLWSSLSRKIWPSCWWFLIPFSRIQLGLFLHACKCTCTSLLFSHWFALLHCNQW